MCVWDSNIEIAPEDSEEKGRTALVMGQGTERREKWMFDGADDVKCVAKKRGRLRSGSYDFRKYL
jgi:hypothetical protein